MKASSTPFTFSGVGAVNPNPSSQNDRGAVVRLSLLVVVGLVISGAQLFFTKAYVPLLQLIAVILLGCLFARWCAHAFPKRYVLFALLAALLLIPLPAALAFLQTEALFMNGVWLATGFLLPSVLLQAWRSNKRIPEVYKTVWAWNGKEPEADALNFLESDRLRLRVMVAGKRSRTVKTLAPLSFTLGDVFVQALAASKVGGEWKNDLAGADGEAYDWLFYQRHWFFYKTWLDGEESLWENRVEVKRIIFAKRV